VGEGEPVIDAGCGSGRQARELAAAGYRVVGVDRSPELVAAARAGGVDRAEFVVGDLLEWRPEEPAAAVLCRGVLNDQREGAERARALGSLAEMLRPGGLLVGDVRERDSSARRYAAGRRTERRIDTGSGELALESDSGWDGAEIVVDERIRRGDREWRCEVRMRPWTRDELESGLAAAGFEAVELHDSGAAGARGDRIVFSARARA
jgi:glycine/sarcosine N-methyltransferase